MFAGPNGAGKSTLIKEVATEFPLGYFINADIIEQKLNTRKFIDCKDYLSRRVNQEDWGFFVENNVKDDTRITTESQSLVQITENILVTKQKINSYLAAIIASFFRYFLLQSEDSFSFETVMSHPSKLFFLNKAKENGFKTYLYFISTQDSSINKNRVKIRVSKGGHGVNMQKVESRYFRSMELLYDAFLFVDRAYIIDNSAENERRVLVEKKYRNVEIYSENIPEWIKIYLLDKI